MHACSSDYMMNGYADGLIYNIRISCSYIIQYSCTTLHNIATYVIIYVRIAEGTYLVYGARSYTYIRPCVYVHVCVHNYYSIN